MKKILFLLLTAILTLPLITQAQQEITIGTGTSTTYYTPFNSLWGYSFVEAIYTASEITAAGGSAGDITSISYEKSSGSEQTNNIVVYMKNVSRSSFSGNTDWEQVTAADIVYQGSWTIPTTGWSTITLDVPFTYDGTSNLMIAFHEYTSGYTTQYFYYTTATNSVISFHSDSSDPNPYSLGSYSGTIYTQSNRANIKIEITDPSGCRAPRHLTIGNITTDEADFSWSPGETETDWEVFISENVVPDSNTIGTAVTDTFYTFTGLNANTPYNAYVRSYCSTDGTYSAWRTIAFRTACDNITTLPYSENFDTYGTGDPSYPTCWYKINTYSSNRPYINSTHYDGVGSLYFYTGTSGTYNIAITPQFDASLPINTLQANFMYRANSTTDRLIVGVMDDPTDASTFVQVATIQPESTTSTWAERTVTFDNYTGTGQYIAFKNEYTSTTAYAYIDNLVIETIPSCVKPTLVHTSNVTATTVDVDWTATDDQYAWEIVVVPTGTAVTDGTPESTSTHPYTVTGLNDQTSYDVYVRANCGSDYSSWSYPAHFTTNPHCSSPLNVTMSQVTGTSALVSWNPAQYGATSYTVEYSVAGQDSWNMQLVDGTEYMISGLEPATDYEVMVYSNCDLGTADTIERNFSTHCLAGGDPFTEGTSTAYTIPVNNYYHYSYTQQIYLASEMGGSSTIDSIAFEYAYSTASTVKTDVVIYLGHTSQSSFSSTSSYIPLSSLTQVYSGHLNCHQGWNTFVLSTPFQYNGTDNLVLVVDDNSDDYDGINYTFNVHNAGATRTLYFYSDSYNPAPSNPTSAGASSSTTSNRSNVKFFIPCDNTVTCVAPNVFVTGTTSESITLDWAPGLSESSWEMEYSTDNSTWTSVGTVNTHPYDLDNLDANTQYYIRLSSNCGGEYSDWVSVSARTACTSVDVPYTENFDDAPASGAGNMVYCWTRGTNSSTAYPYTSNSYHHSGTYSTYFYGASSYYSYIASPLFDDNVQMDNLQVRFWAYKTSASYYIQVGIMEDPNDYSTFVQVGQDVTPSATSTWELFEVNTDNYTGTGRYIAFRIPMGTSSNMYIDDIEVDYIPLCAHVTNLHTVANSITPDAADIAWTAGGDETEWQVVYGPAGSIIDPELETAETVYTPEISLTNLSGNTLYDVYVKAVCGSENSTWVHISFRTDCGIVTALPFVENFDTYGTGTSAYPTCWTKINTYTSDRPYINTTNYSAPGCLYFYAGNSGTYNIAVSPRFDASIPINTLQATFMYRGYYASDRLIVGVMTDSADANTFVPIETIAPDASYTTWVEREVDFSQYTGNGQFIAFKNAYTSTSGYAYVDNLKIEPIPSCPKPRNIVFSNITSEGANVNWTPYGTESAWEVVAVPAGHAISEGIPEYTMVRPYTLIGLDDETAYDVYVRANCDGGENSDWSVAGTFTTTPLCSSPNNVTVTQVVGTSALVSWSAALYGAIGYTVEYTVTGQNNWTTAGTTDATQYMLSGLDPTTSYTVRVTSDCPNGTASPAQATFVTNCLAGGDLLVGNGTSTSYNIPLNTYYNYSYVQQLYLASELNFTGDISSIGFQYIYSTSQTKTNQSIYLAETNLTSLSTWIPADSLTLVYSGTVNYNNSGTDNWVTITFTTPFNYSGRNLVVVVKNDDGDYTTSNNNTFKTHSASGMTLHYYDDDYPFSLTSPESPETYLYRNNIKFGTECDPTVTCIAPNVYATEVTANSITLDWAPGYSESSWELETSTDNITWSSEGTITSTPYTISNLNPNTLYYVRMRSDCGGGEYSNWTTLSERTACAAISTLPFMENFDSWTGATTTSVATNNLPNCWNYHNAGTNTSYSGYPIIYNSTTYAVSGTNSMRFYTSVTASTYDDQVAILPEIDVNTLPMNTLQLTFDARDNTTSYPFDLVIGVMTDPTDINTFMPVSSVTTSSTTYANYEIPLSLYTGTGAYIAIKAPQPTTGYNYGYVDNVKVELIPSCPKPTQVHAVNVTTNTVELGWTENGSATSWVIEYGPAGFTLGTGTTETATTNPYTISGLTASTSYDFYIRSDCGGGDYSNYSSGYSTATACDAINQLPYTEDFDSYGTGEGHYPNCWGKINTYSSDRPYCNTSNHYAGTASLYFYTGSSGTYNIAVTPPFDASIPVNTLQATFMYRANGTSDKLIVGVMTNPVDASTFVPIDTIIPASSATTWVEKEVVFYNYNGSGQYIAFKNAYTTTIAYAYIDNLSIDLIPSCPKPQHLQALNSTTSSIELGWNEVGSATSWEIAYGAPGFDPDGTDANLVTATSNPFTINNLNNSTTYEFYVRALCGGSDVSYWSTNLQTSTTMIPTSLPYTADFSDPSDAWVLNNGSCPNYWMRGTVNNDPALFVTSNGSTPEYTNSATSVAALKLFTVGTVDSITISFDIMVDGEGSYDYFKLFLAPASQQFPASTTAPGSGDYGYNDYSINAYNFYANGYGTQSSHPYILNKLTAGIHVTATMPNPNATPSATSTALLALAWKNDGSVLYNPPATITNLTVTASGSGPVITDPTVTTTAASAITQNSATLNATITNPDNVTITAKGFEWKLTNGGTYTQIAGTGTGNTFTANLTGLTANTGYTFKAFITFNGTTVYGSETTFTTLPEDVEPCNAPTNLQISNITQNSATATWTPGGNENAWNVQYKLQSSQQWQEANVQQPTYTIEGLTANSIYDVRVKAVCAADNQSDFVSTTFTTTGVGIDNLTLANSISLMPNPADNYIDLNVNSNVNVKEAVVYNAFGQMIQKVELTDNHARIDLSDMASGMYFVRVNGEGVSATKKFIKR
ncbi:MAG: fibronectin type III domain-containing protein [Bacteroidales bacterium]|nr:fibronectin type III domain-containing protein [Bacteroidales bacterium]